MDGGKKKPWPRDNIELRLEYLKFHLPLINNDPLIYLIFKRFLAAPILDSRVSFWTREVLLYNDKTWDRGSAALELEIMVNPISS